MPIDRAPFNALVDDDGSNLVGSVWNKAAIASVILDPTDVALAALPQAGAWIIPAFDPADYYVGIGSGSWAVEAGDILAVAYSVVGKTVHFDMHITASFLTGAGAVGLTRKMFGGLQLKHTGGGLFMHGINSAGYWQTSTGPSSVINLFTDINGTVWPAGNVTVRVSGNLEIV
jgi:hypothetical protein